MACKRTPSTNGVNSPNKRQVAAEAFGRLSCRLLRAAREIEIVNTISEHTMFMHELTSGRDEAPAARAAALAVDTMSLQECRAELKRLTYEAENVEDHAWRRTAFYAHSVGDIDIHQLRNKQRRGLLMELVALRVGAKPFPLRLIDRYMTSADKAERLMRLLAA